MRKTYHVVFGRHFRGISFFARFLAHKGGRTGNIEKKKKKKRFCVHSTQATQPWLALEGKQRFNF